MVEPEKIIIDIKKAPYTFFNLTLCTPKKLCIIGPKPVKEDNQSKEPRYGYSDDYIDRFRPNSNGSSTCHSFYFGVINIPSKRKKLEESMSDCCVSLMQLARSGIINYNGCSEKKMHNWILNDNVSFMLSLFPSIESFEGTLEKQIDKFFSLDNVKEFFHDFIENNYL